VEVAERLGEAAGKELSQYPAEKLKLMPSETVLGMLFRLRGERDESTKPE
jgi:hypothetical protein